jgi:flagellum-specific peptidoglycan hydrolase FlgJ
MAKKEDFVKNNIVFARAVQDKTGIAAEAILTQAALESGWGRVAPGNMYFGVKDTDGINGNEQLLTTTEYHNTMDVKYPVIISITPVVISGKKKFKYKIKDYFRKYPTPFESFLNHASFFFKNKRYSKALESKHDASLFLSLVAKAGYATDPSYNEKLQTILKDIVWLIQNKGL